MKRIGDGRARGMTSAAGSWVLVLAGCALAAACGGGSADGPGAAAENLYTTLRQAGVTGAPTSEQLARLEPYISDTLRALLAAANRMRETDIRRFPDEKPSFAEGDLFSSLFEGPSSFRVAETEAGRPPHRVRVDFTHAADGTRTNWSDVVVVVREGERWVVDNVEYRGAWDFAAQGSLRMSLELAVGY